MKKKFLLAFLLLVFVGTTLLGITACDGTSTGPQKLSTPVVALNGSVASWGQDENADKFEISLNGVLSYVEISITSKTLSNGDTIKVRAVGDGTNYSTSDWSNSVTYTLGGSSSTPDDPGATPDNPTPPGTSIEPEYLGIFASNSEPSSSNGLPEEFAFSRSAFSVSRLSAREYRDFNTALKELFEDENNRFNDYYPIASDYDIYSEAGNTVYIEIWLNNPSQHTILSLKLNGTKYQVSGGLSSFFIYDSGFHYNCVYVGVTIPNDAHTEKEYVVSEIEYISGTYINADGTDEFMNENDTVTIGLPYGAQRPVVSNYNCTLQTTSEYSASFNISNAEAFVNASGGWVGVAIYDNTTNYEIILNQQITDGNVDISVTGLVENSQYSVIVYVFGDIHDGRGVNVCNIYYDWIFTSEAISINKADAVFELNDKGTGYVGAINVSATLFSNTAEYIKLEILDSEEQIVYTDENFSGDAVVTENILNGKDYTVKVYYKDTSYPEGKSVEKFVYIPELSDTYVDEDGFYAFVNDAVFYFNFSSYNDNYAGVDNFKVRFFDDESANYIAEEVLLLIDDTELIQKLTDRLYELYGKPEFAEEMNEVHNKLQRLNHANTLWQDRYEGNSDKAFWQAEQAKGKYCYEFSYDGVDTENIYYINGYYYVYVNDVNSFNNGLYDVEFLYYLDKNDGKGLKEMTDTANVRFETVFLEDLAWYEGLGVKDYLLDGEDFSFTLVNPNDVRIENDDDRETSKDKRYVYKIEINGKTVFSDETVVDAPSVDESAWIEEYLNGVRNGNLDSDALYKKYLTNYQEKTVTLDLSETPAGMYSFLIHTRKYGVIYEEDEGDECIEIREVAVIKEYEVPTLDFEGLYGYIKVAEIARDYRIEIEAYDANNNEITDIYIDWDYEKGARRFEFPYPGGKARVRLVPEHPDSCWKESNWSEYKDATAIKLSKPVITQEGSWLRFSSNDGEYVLGYTYIIGNGGEMEGSSVYVGNLTTTTVIKVKVRVSDQGKEAGYCDSDWKEYTYIYSGNSDKK